MILVADSLDEAAAILAKDPAVTEGKFIGSVSAWRPVIDPKNLLSPGMNSSR